MLKVGITGGIGSGKSTVCRIFELCGVAVYNTDKNATRLMNEDDALIEAIIGLLGTKAYDEQGRLDRKYVAGKVFNNPGLLQRLNSIVHPAVGRDFIHWAKIQDTDYVVLESAILFESGFDRIVDRTVTVSAPEDMRIRRVMQRDGLAEKDVRARIANQMSDAERESRSDYVIHSTDTGTPAAQVDALHKIFSRDARK